jgi:hypothetical protein
VIPPYFAPTRATHTASAANDANAQILRWNSSILVGDYFFLLTLIQCLGTLDFSAQRERHQAGVGDGVVEAASGPSGGYSDRLIETGPAILELDSPFSGLVRVSAEPMRQALAEIMRDRFAVAGWVSVSISHCR